jgi:MFS transporter, ACS family, hexuronate transporter
LTTNRWRIAILVSAAIAISYLDRQTLPVAIKAIEKEIPVSNARFADLQSAFLFAYALMYLGGGRLMDLLGTRRGFLLTMSFWSLACASHGLAKSFTTLMICRCLLGIGEGGGFPAATRAMAEWFSVRQRSMAMGIINAGSAVGGIIAPPMIGLVLAYTNWHWVFFITGAIGLLWTLWWLVDYQEPDRNDSPAKTGGGAQAELQAEPVGVSMGWVDLLRYVQTYGIVLAKFLTDAAWFLYLFWLPKYLYDARGFDTKGVALFAWMPPAASFIGCLAGGGFSSWLLHRQFSLNLGRKISLGLSASLMPLMMLVVHVPVGGALLLFCIGYFGHQSWSTVMMTLPTDLYPRKVIGSIAGMMGFGGAMGGVVLGEVAGKMLDHGTGYGPVFVLAGSLHVIGFLVVLVTVRRIAPLAEPKVLVAQRVA